MADTLIARHFSYAGLGILVRTNARAPLAWLEEFLGPAFLAPSSAADRVIVLHIDPRAPHVATPDNALLVDTFALDGHFEPLPVVTRDEGLCAVADARADATIAVPVSGPIQITARADGPRLRTLLMRAVREVATLRVVETGGVLVHGAAASYEGQGIVIAGAKRAGKSTSLLSLLRHPDTAYLSNDRAALVAEGGALRVVGMPTIAKVRDDSPRYVPTLPPLPDPNRTRHYLTLEEIHAGSGLLAPTRHAVPPMSPAQCAHWLEVPMAASAPLSAMVFPRVDAAVERFTVRRLGMADAAVRVRQALLSGGRHGLVSTVFATGWRGTIPGEDVVGDACARIGREVACYDCTIGPRAFERPDVWDAIAALGR